MASKSIQDASTLSLRWSTPCVGVAQLSKYSIDIGLGRTNFVTRTSCDKADKTGSTDNVDTNKFCVMSVVPASAKEFPYSISNVVANAIRLLNMSRNRWSGDTSFAWLLQKRSQRINSLGKISLLSCLRTRNICRPSFWPGYVVLAPGRAEKS